MWLALAAICLGDAHPRHLHERKPRSPIAGSHQAQLNQNAEIDRLRLPRIVNDEQLEQLERDGELVNLQSDFTIIADDVQPDKRYARVWTVQFVRHLAERYSAQFGARLQINSAVRTETQQRRLRMFNRYAAPPDESSHVAGITVDLAKRTLTPTQRKWLVAYLKYWRDMGIIEAVEEPYCFHVAVFDRYLEYENDQSLQAFQGTERR